MKASLKVIYSPTRLASRINALGRKISQDFAGRTVDVVIVLESSFVFAADLMRRISAPVVCHFVRADVRDVVQGDHERREVFFSHSPRLEGRDVLVVDAVLHTGVTQDFLCKRLQESRPRSLRLAVLLDKPRERRVDLKPDYFGFVAASNYLAGYGLAGSRGWYRNLPYIGARPPQGRRLSARAGQARQAR